MPLVFHVAGGVAPRRRAAIRGGPAARARPPSQWVPRKRQAHLQGLPRDPTYVEPAETKHDYGVKRHVQDKNAERKIGGILLEFG